MWSIFISLTVVSTARLSRSYITLAYLDNSSSLSLKSTCPEYSLAIKLYSCQILLRVTVLGGGRTRTLYLLRLSDVGDFSSLISILKFLWSSSSRVSKLSLDRNTVACNRSSVIERRQRIVACKTNIFDFGLRNKATPNKERQFQPSFPFSTRIINCFSFPAVPGISRLLKSLISLFLVYFSSPTFNRILSAEIPNSTNICSSLGFTNETASSTFAA